MRILLLTQVVPYPPDSGPKVKTYNLLRSLAAHHEVTLVSLVRSAAEEAHAEALRPLCAAVYTARLRRSRLRDAYFLARSLLRGESFIMARDECRELHELLRSLTLTIDFDIIHADQLNMAQFARDLPCGARVLDEHNAVWTIVQRMALQSRLGPRRLILDLEARRLRRYEARVCAHFDAVLAVSEPDRQALLLAAAEAVQDTTALDAKMAVVPIAVDAAGQQVVSRQSNPRMILSMATMFWPPNVDGVLWFAREVYPLVRQRVPDAHFTIMGARPPQRVHDLATNDPSISVTGYVDDPMPHLAASAALIVPVRAGGGMRVKILEALARGIPIVTTTIGYEGIDVVAGEHLLVGDTPEEFADALVRLLEDPALGRLLTSAGHRLAEARYDWRVVNAEVGRMYERLLARTSSALREAAYVADH